MNSKREFICFCKRVIKCRTTDDILKSYKVYDDIEFKYVDDEEVLKKYLVKNNKK